MRYERHIFVCTNERPPNSRRGCCASKGGMDILRALKARVRELGLKESVRANNAGCLDFCEQGASIVVYPEAVWYGGVTVEDVEEILQQHIIGGQPVERLRKTEQSADK